MALYYSLVFGLLVFEMAFFTILSLPFPRNIRKSVLKTISKPFQSEKFQIAIKCILGFITILFVDSVNRVTSVTSELNTHPTNPMAGGLSERSEVQARRFYAQRNMYLCGFTLFLTLILTRTYSLVGELILTKDKLDNAKLATPTTLGDSTQLEEVKKLKALLIEKDEELEILKEQATALSSDYESVSGNVKARKV